MNQSEYNTWSASASRMAGQIVNNPQSLLDNKNLFDEWPSTTN
jgi:hypothetical protein